MPLRAVDFHVHLPTPDWLDGSMAGYVEAAEQYFRSPARRESLEQLAERYRELNVKAVLLAWDAETATSRPRVPNETVAEACERFPDAFTGLGSVDPHKGEQAVAEIANIAALGLRGVKFHPSLQAFPPAAHPELTIVAAHFGWPWQMDLIAIALHKTNVYIDISGWAPKRIPAEVIRELRGRLAGQFLWGSDFPFFSPQRCLDDLADLDLPADVTRALLHDNAARILGFNWKHDAADDRPASGAAQPAGGP